MDLDDEELKATRRLNGADEKIEVGEYVRTKDGFIAEIVNKNDFREPSMRYGVEANYLKDIAFIGDDDIVKHSHNIIDLIEPGDYVNGKYIKMNYEIGKLQIPKKIKSIVTKEKFESVEYKVED